MSVKVSKVMEVMDRIAPRSLAFAWDNVGLLVGEPAADVQKALFSLDLSDEVIDEALAIDAELIITHHPLLFKPLQAVRTDLFPSSLVKRLLVNEINLFCAHTNLDQSPQGVNHCLAKTIGLQNLRVLKVEKTLELFKLVVFVPESHAEKVKAALGDAGAGYIGNYSHCNFAVVGQGEFKPLAGSTPFIGGIGEIERVMEVRLETIVPKMQLDRVVKQMHKSHPYEEVAYDIYPLKNLGEGFGLGMLGDYLQPLDKDDFIKLIKQGLKIPSVRIAGQLPKQLKRVAVCGGSGGNMIAHAAFSGAQALLTGDVGYHQAQEAAQLNIATIDAGHGATERLVMPHLANLIEQELDLEVFISKAKNEPWQEF